MTKVILVHNCFAKVVKWKMRTQNAFNFSIAKAVSVSENSTQMSRNIKKQTSTSKMKQILGFLE